MSAPDIASSINVKELGNRINRRKSQWYLANIPLNIIDFINWEPSRYKNNLKLISDTKSVKPVILGDLDNTTQKYSLCDGNHRCYCSNELGYTHIPAIVSKKISDSRFEIIPYIIT
jgi:hypothetical protein